VLHGFVSVNAGLILEVYHSRRKMSRAGNNCLIFRLSLNGQGSAAIQSGENQKDRKKNRNLQFVHKEVTIWPYFFRMIKPGSKENQAHPPKHTSSLYLSTHLCKPTHTQKTPAGRPGFSGVLSPAQKGGTLAIREKMDYD